ncbi:S-adenosyl-L-methionine-dependent methyltransferase [Artomyces pyxidatus]|uniref:S-adenosyl-L-methionine-dependent methyltransferase n=1 Tax=Artomyces pyxidatus TaxID=48021 RepID=A0ACB8SXM8_9AGAM|nr:S-adenosyl-L-methionine-dependent methyltransferase [Artomyces pyxidatus]
MALRTAIRTLEAACYQLCATLAPPTLSMANRGMMIRETTITRVAIEAQVTDILREYPQGMHARDISQRTGIESGKLARILRALAVKHIYREVEPDVFANNRLSLVLASDHPTAALLGHWFNECNRSEANLYETLTDPETGPSYDPSKSSFARTMTDCRQTIFDWYTSHPKESERFGKAMIGYGYVSDSHVAANKYPWSTLSAGTTVCDVGGGIGAVLILLGQKYPHLKLTLQDLPNVMDQARQFWQEGCPEAIQDGRIDFVAIDFFKEPPVKGQDIYYVKQVFHDWPDHMCQLLIQNIRKAMKPGSRLLIHDYILRNACRQGGSGPGATPAHEWQAPKPLLPTWGAGNSRPYTQDINMMNLHNSKERTLEEFAQLGREVGLHVIKVWDFLETGMVEFQTE